MNSQEWTLSRGVPDLRLGIVGSLSSGKSALVHRYLTGSYMQEESPEGGRFKKEICVNDSSHLLLIRDEGGPPEMQVNQTEATPTRYALNKKKVFFIITSIIVVFYELSFHSLFQFTAWVDAVIFVFSLENDASFNAIHNYYRKMTQFRGMRDIPLILVGTQGKHERT